MDIDKLMQKWMPNNEELIPYYMGVSSFVKDNIEFDRHGEGENLSNKIIADPLLGYINLTPLEVAIIDTGLYQRLRKIKQLGLADLVFPSLSYSRFEHSIGVLGRLNQILNKLTENYNRKNPDFDLNIIIKKYNDSIRLAALMHDIGHCIYSHCSERVINEIKGTDSYPSAYKIRELFTCFFKKDKLIPFAELFSVSIIGSKEFADYIINLNIFKKKETYKILENGCRFILGLPIENEPQTVFLSQLMSCGLDVDKIDYMMREQHYTGIKLEIDFDRITSKLNVFDLNSYELPKNLEFLKKHFDANRDFKVLGFSKGGQFVFEEFCIARLALNVKIYLHQKVRTAEGQLSMLLKNLSNNETGYREKELQKVHNWLTLPESIIENPKILNSFFQSDGLFAQTPFISEKQENGFRNISQRKLFCRAFAFGQINSFSEAPLLENKNAAQEIEDFFITYNEQVLYEKIAEKAEEIFDCLGENVVNKSELRNFIVDIPRLRFKSIQQGHESLYFERPPLSPLKWTIPLDKIVIYFEENRALGYIFAQRNVAHYLSLAAEKVIFEINNKVFSQEGNISKDTYEQVIDNKKKLTTSNYYRELLKFNSLKISKIC
jgi:HD superfamily phosphohydrolase